MTVGAVILTLTDSPGASAFVLLGPGLRSWIVLPITVPVQVFADGPPLAVATLMFEEAIGPCTGVKPVIVAFAEPSDCVLTVLAEHGAGLLTPQFRIVIVTVDPAGVGVGASETE
jgi:hypothetical protein